MASLPPLTWLRAFEAAARHLSFTQAAAELNLTQSAVSQHVRSLEAALGLGLFVRKTRALQLTEAGSNYLPIVQDAFEILGSGTRALTGGDRGRRLMVTCNLAFSTFWLAPRLGGLLAAHPWLSLNLSTPIWDPLRGDGGPEVEIRFGRAALMPGTAERLAVERVYPVCAPATGPDMRRWESAPLFDTVGVTANWDSWLSSQGFSLPRDRSVTLASTYVVTMTAALAGGGLAITHDSLARGLLADGRLERPYGHSVDMPEGYFLLALPKHEETPAARTFVEWIGAEFARAPADFDLR